MKVLYLTTVPAPYKCAFFEELGKKCNLTVVFENDAVSYRENGWMTEQYENYEAAFLKGLKIKDKRISNGIIKIIKEGKFDAIIVSVYSTFSQMAAQQWMIRKKIPYILSSDGGMLKGENTVNKRIKEHFIGSASLWLSTGKTTNNYLEYYGAKKERIVIYPFTSIDDSKVLRRPISAAEKRKIRTELNTTDQKIVLAVGQFIHRKGYDILLESAKSLDDNTGVYIVGGTPSAEYLSLKEEYQLKNVHFVGFMDADSLSKYYKAADVFVHPTREDIWGLVVNEAMAYGLPVITTDRCVAGLEMVKNSDVGSIIPIEDPAALSGAIGEWLAKEVSENQSQKILDIAREYTVQEMANKHFEILQEYVNAGTD